MALQKVLFLDVDGVLNKLGTPQRNPHGARGVDPLMCAELKRIVDQTGCDIVLSSTWRKFDDLVEYLFAKLDPSVRRAIIGKTEVLGCGVRGEEIQLWLDSNTSVSQFVIVDDDADMVHLTGMLVPTNDFEGLTAEIADKIIDRLNNPIPEYKDDNEHGDFRSTRFASEDDSLGE